MLKENDSLVQVKICGLTSMDDVHIIEKYGADYAGMVLYYPCLLYTSDAADE